MSKKDKKRGGGDKSDYQTAMGRLEDAVKDLGEAAKGNFTERAAEVLEQTAAKLKSEFKDEPDLRGEPDSSEWSRDDEQWKYKKSNNGRLRHWRGDRAARPFRDLDNARIWGVCAGFAPYLGVEIWVARCLAITALLFMPQVIIPAYIISYFVLDAYSELDELVGPGASSNRRLRKRMRQSTRAQERAERRAEKRSARADARAARKGKTRSEPTAPPPVPARTVLRHARGTINEAELRLRRMEGHVTSGRYELQRELRKIEGA